MLAMYAKIGLDWTWLCIIVFILHMFSTLSLSCRNEDGSATLHIPEATELLRLYDRTWIQNRNATCQYASVSHLSGYHNYDSLLSRAHH